MPKTWFWTNLPWKNSKLIKFYIIFWKFDLGGWGNRKKKKSPQTPFFCFVGILWGRKEGQCSWFGSKPYFESLRRKNHLGRSCRRSASFCSLTIKASLKMILTIMIVHLKMLSINVRNSTFNYLFVYLMCICMLL